MYVSSLILGFHPSLFVLDRHRLNNISILLSRNSLQLPLLPSRDILDYSPTLSKNSLQLPCNTGMSSVEEGEMMDVENLLESCWGDSVAGDDSVVKKILRRQRVEDWKRGILWKGGGYVMPIKRSLGVGVCDDEYELEEGEFVPSESLDDQMSCGEDGVSRSLVDGFVDMEADELEEGELVDSPVRDYEIPGDKSNSMEECECAESLLREYETPSDKSNSKEECDFVQSELGDYENPGHESDCKEDGEFAGSLSRNYKNSGDESDYKEDSEFVDSLFRDYGSPGDESHPKEDGEFVGSLFLNYEKPCKEEGESGGLASVGDEKLTAKEEGGFEDGELEDADFCHTFWSSTKQKSGQSCEKHAEPLDAVQKHYGPSDGLATDFKVEAHSAFVDCGFVEHSDFSISADTLDGAKSSIPVESPHSQTTYSFELDQVGPPEPMVLDTLECLNSLRESIDLAETFESQTPELPTVFHETQLCDSAGDANGFDSKNFLNTVSHAEGKDPCNSLVLQLPVDSTLPSSEQLKDSAKSQASSIFESIEQSLFKNLPRRRVSADRTFPVGCGRQSLLDMFGGCQKSAQNFIAKRLGDTKSFGENKNEQFVGVNAKQRREEVKYEDAYKEKWGRNITQGINFFEHAHVRKDVDGKLKQKCTNETSGMLSLDRVIRSSNQEQSSKPVTISNGTSTKGNSPGKYVEGSQFINPPRVEKYGVVKLLTEGETVQALKAGPNCPWRLEKHTFRHPLGLARSTTKSITKKHDLIAENDSNSISRRSYDVVEDNFFGHDEEDDSPLFKSLRNIELTSTASCMNTFCDKDVDIQSGVARNKVRKTLRLFQTICRILLRGEEGKANEVGRVRRVDLKSATILKENNKCLNTGVKILGTVPGVEVGDEFHYRAELTVIGLHSHHQNGIDYLNRDGKILATSIVASGGYDDFMDSSDVLIYSGQGGNPTRGATVATDQKLVRGNLALKNSKDEQTPVRVIRGFKEAKDHDTVAARTNMVATLTYDGLYLVEKYWIQKGCYGNNVFMFQLRRISGQPELAIKEVKKFKKVKIREGICVRDISYEKERIPIGAVNTIDNEKPPAFVYLAQMKHSVRYNPTPSEGCQCKGGCFGSSKCSCAMKNGGQIPYNYNGAIVEAKPLVYECGPKCQCPPSCHNRVSQHGIKFPLELFKTKFRGWGVRSLKSIPSGSFICEYTGELIQEDDAEQRTGNDEYLFDVGRNYDDHALWEGLSNLIPSDLKSSSLCESVEDVGFTIDAAQQGNVGRFINHSCSPNLYAQNVLYEHNDNRMPHIMLFATENIPPMEELTYHYNMALDQVRDQEGNIKKKKCYCGSSECTGRIY